MMSNRVWVKASSLRILICRSGMGKDIEDIQYCVRWVPSRIKLKPTEPVEPLIDHEVLYRPWGGGEIRADGYWDNKRSSKPDWNITQYTGKSLSFLITYSGHISISAHLSSGREKGSLQQNLKATTYWLLPKVLPIGSTEGNWRPLTPEPFHDNIHSKSISKLHHTGSLLIVLYKIDAIYSNNG